LRYARRTQNLDLARDQRIRFSAGPEILLRTRRRRRISENNGCRGGKARLRAHRVDHRKAKPDDADDGDEKRLAPHHQQKAVEVDDILDQLYGG